MISQVHRARKKGGGEECADRTGGRRHRQRNEGRLQLRVKVGVGTGPRICEVSALCPICVCVCVLCERIYDEHILAYLTNLKQFLIYYPLDLHSISPDKVSLK